MELIDEVDYNGNVIATHSKEELKKRMFLHKVSLIIPTTEGNKIVLSKRAKDKHPYPNTWCCAVGGKVSSGETEEQAAMREMKEELGMNYPIKKVASFIYDKDDYKAIFSIFTTDAPVSLDEFVIDPDEIQYSEGFQIGTVMEMLSKNPEEFAPTFNAAIKELIKHYK